MAKVFMSVLGTTCYVESHYKMNDEISPLTPFVQEAYLRLTQREWSQGDRLVLFLTEEARCKNWEDGGNFHVGLKSRLENLSLGPLLFPVPFKEGRSEEEIMENFLTLLNQLQPGDEVVFDITHSFRSLPMLNLVALNYVRVLKGIKIDKIYYGALEVLGPFAQVRAMPEEKRVAPIFDLTPYAALLDWTFAVDEFTRFGLVERLAELVRERVEPILRDTRGKDHKAAAVRNFVNHLRGLTMDIYTCRCPRIFKAKVEDAVLKELPVEGLLPAFAPLVERVRKKVKGFEVDDPWEKSISAVKWCIDHRLIQQGYTILLESTITEVYRLFGLEDLKAKEKDVRGFISSLLCVVGQNKDSKTWQGNLEKLKGRALEIVSKGGEPFKKLAQTYDQLNDFRNDINHCGCRGNPRKAGDLEDKLKEHFENIKEAMKALRQAIG